MACMVEGGRQSQQPKEIAIASNSTRSRHDNHKLDDLLLAQALRRRGAKAYIIDWRNPNIRPSEFDIVVLRSTWDCHKYPEEFMAWLEEAGDRVVNCVEIVRWNYSKEQYLAELQRVFPSHVVQSKFYSLSNHTVPFEAETEPATILVDCKEKLGSSSLVFKPTISAEGDETYCFNMQDEHQSIFAQAKLGELLMGNHGVIVQPMLEGIKQGEYQLVFIGGQFTHAVKKPGGFKNSSEIERQGIDEQELGQMKEIAEKIIAYTIEKKGWLAYARVDLVPEEHGPVLLELELVDPNLQLVCIPETCYAKTDSTGGKRSRETVHPTLTDVKTGDARQHQVIEQFVDVLLDRHQL